MRLLEQVKLAMIHKHLNSLVSPLCRFAMFVHLPVCIPLNPVGYFQPVLHEIISRGLQITVFRRPGDRALPDYPTKRLC